MGQREVREACVMAGLIFTMLIMLWVLWYDGGEGL